MGKRYAKRAEKGVAGVQKRTQWAMCRAVRMKRMRQALCRAAIPGRLHRAACCAVILTLVLLLCSDMVLPPQPLLPELGIVEQQLRALTADAPDGWRYSLRVLPGPGGGTLAADAARRNALGTWETIQTLWRYENGTWRMVRQTRQKYAQRLGESSGAKGGAQRKRKAAILCTRGA